MHAEHTGHPHEKPTRYANDLPGKNYQWIETGFHNLETVAIWKRQDGLFTMVIGDYIGRSEWPQRYDYASDCFLLSNNEYICNCIIVSRLPIHSNSKRAIACNTPDCSNQSSNYSIRKILKPGKVPEIEQEQCNQCPTNPLETWNLLTADTG